MTETVTIRSGERIALPALARARLQWLLVIPLLAFLTIFFVVPVGLMLATSFNPQTIGQVTVTAELTLENYLGFFNRSNYMMAAGRSLALGGIVAALTLVIAYPMAFVIAKTKHPGRNTALLILVLAAMQLDMVIRLYGMMVILGDEGLINQMLRGLALIGPEDSVQFMYNFLGVVLGMVQFALPFMILTLVGVIRGIDPSLEEAARSLGASWWRAFFRVTLPMSLPGILAGSLLVFALSISSYIVPALMGGFRVGVLPIHIFQQVAEGARFQFGATIAVILFLLSAGVIVFYLRAVARASGGRA